MSSTVARSAASRQASTSSALRTLKRSSTWSASSVATTEPRVAGSVTRPSCCSIRRASRTGSRDTLNSAARSRSTRRAPGAYWPSKILLRTVSLITSRSG